MTNPWVAIVGTRDQGRRQVLDSVLEALRQAGLRLGGVVQETILRDGERAGFDVVDLASGQRRPLAREAPDPQLCTWGFDGETFAQVRRWIDAEPCDVVTLSLGSLEAAGQGYWPTVLANLDGPPRLLLLEIRPNVLSAVALRLPDPEDGVELPAGEDEVAEFASRVAEAARAVAKRGSSGGHAAST